MTAFVNDTPIDFFSTYKGLRQRDPLSPYLFVLIMEAFNDLIAKVEEGGFIRVGGTENVDRAIALFGCKVGKLPTTYLELQPINLLQWLTYGGRKEMEMVVKRCTSEDLSNIGNWRR
ncbi:hypothetical protein AAG906_007111 [Vitis piasezkii]